MQDLNVLLVQSDTVWADPEANHTNLSRLLEKQTADLIVLPETFSTGFCMTPQPLAESMSGQTVAWMKTQAKALGATITGSVIVGESGRCYNRLLWVSPNGNIDSYDKRHLFTLMGENNHYSPGAKRKIFNLNGWRICPQICYDLRFPVWCRNNADYDALLFVANWPQVRQFAWRSLLVARAIENQCYVVAVNRVGRDNNQLDFAGDSLAIDPLGETVVRMGTEAGVSKVTLSASALGEIRQKFQFLADRDSFQIL